LKAFLLLEEQSERYIRLNIRHDLHKALKKAKELGIQRAVNITDADEYEIVKANEWYDRKGFEYFSFQNLNAGKDTLPNLEVLEAVAKQLIEKLESICRATSQ
jgi:N-acetylglutamate synthase-like GNAT family acetyltransferase